MEKSKRLFYNLIAVLLLVLMLSLSMLGGRSLTAVALEQEARCGFAEHVHGAECYLGEVLLCEKKAHTHSEGCYLILLKDNDINWLLQTVDEAEEKSLEYVIDIALNRAVAVQEKPESGKTEPEVRQWEAPAMEAPGEPTQAAEPAQEVFRTEHEVVLNDKFSEEALMNLLFPTEPSEKAEPAQPELTVPPETSRPTEPPRPTEAPRPTSPPKPTEPEPTEGATEPTEEETEPTAETTEPIQEATEPTEETTEPTEEVTEPTVEETKPTEAATEPTEEETEPTEGATEPTGEETEPTEEATEPTGEATEPTEETTIPTEEETESTEEATEPTGEATEPTEETTVPAEEETEPSEETTVPTEEATEPTEATTEPTEETTAPTEEPAAPESTAAVFNWEADGRVNMLAEQTQEDGYVGLYIYLDDTWTYVSALEMDTSQKSWGTNHTLDSAVIREGYSEAAVVSDQTLSGALYYSDISPAEGIDGITAAAGDTVYFGTDGAFRHFYLVTGQRGDDGQITYSPVQFYTVTLYYGSPISTFSLTRAAAPQAEVEYVQSGEDATLTLSEDYTWVDKSGNTVTSLDNITEPVTLYAVERAAEEDTSTSAMEDMAVGDSTSSRPVYIEIYVINETSTGEWIRVSNTLEYTNRYVRSGGGSIYYKTVSPGDIDSALDSVLESDIGSIGDDYSLLYGSSWTETGSVSIRSGRDTTTYTTFGTGNTTGEITARLYESNATAAMEFAVLTYQDLDGAVSSRKIYKRDTIVTVEEPPEGYVWEDQDGARYESGDTVTLSKSITLKPVQDKVGVTYYDRETNALLESYPDIEPGTAHTVPDAPDGYLWVYEDGSRVDTTQPITVNTDLVIYAVPSTYTITLIDPSGRTIEKTASYDEEGTLSALYGDELPDGWSWIDESGTVCTTYGPVTQNMTFTAAEKTITVNYDVNFTYNVSVGTAVNNIKSRPSIYGTTAETAAETVRGGNSAVTKDLTNRVIEKIVSSSNAGCQVYFFKGWTMDGTDLLIPPDTALSWDFLETYADENGEVNLKGVWEEPSYKTAVTFYIRYDSVAVDTDGDTTGRDTNLYTPQIFSTYVGGTDTVTEDLSNFDIADTTQDNSLGADREIRKLYGEKATGLWLYDFPKDEDVFAYLKAHLASDSSKKLEVDGEAVAPDELDLQHYAIRWYVFKTQSDSWHIDGKLVRREGLIQVTKDFEGDSTAIDAAENGFHIVAQTRDYSPGESHFKQHILVLDQATADALADDYPNATAFHVVDSAEAAHDYVWQISGVLAEEFWTVTEKPVDVAGYTYYAEYSAYDSSGELTDRAEYGEQATVEGKTFALDENPDQGMTVNFTNYYFPEDSILLKKEDGETGLGIGGAGFRFTQKDTTMSFEKQENAWDNYYVRDTGGTSGNLDIVTAGNGYVTISGFSYQYGAGDENNDLGSITITESIMPTGYGAAPAITLTRNSDGSVAYAIDSDDPVGKWVEMPESNVLVIRNYASDRVSVTANKKWDTTVPRDSVEVVLQANGQNAANVFPGLKNAQVELSGDNSWTYTWTDLPRYAGGNVVTWGIKEVKIGNDATMSDGVSFANWIPTYSPGVGTDTDGDGDIDNWRYTVTNTTRSPKLILTKVNSEGTALPGAAFTLEQVQLTDGEWQKVSGTVTGTLTTDGSGMLTFDNLIAGQYYRLTETAAPDGYLLLMEPVVITVDGDGNIRQAGTDGTSTDLNHGFIETNGAYNVKVTNLSADPLPETGGAGTHMYTQCAAALMLFALLMYKKTHRKEETDSS